MRVATITAAVILLVIGGLVAAVEPGQLSLFDAISLALWGSTGTYVQFIGTALLFIGFAYLLTVHYADRLDTWMQLELLRYGSAARWLVGVLRRVALPALAFPVVLCIASAAWYFVLGGRSFTLPSSGLASWGFQLLINGALQVVVYVLVLLAATIGTANRVGGLAAAAVLLVLALPRPHRMPMLPVQLSGMDFAAAGWASALPATATLLVTSTLLVAAALVVLQRQRRTA